MFVSQPFNMINDKKCLLSSKSAY